MNILGIGERLRNAREARGLSLDDVEAATRIRRRYLEALEDEAFDRLPGPAYVRGFLNGYASYLGLPSEEIASMYPMPLGARVAVRASPVDVRITPVTPRSRARRFVIGASLVLLCGAAVIAYILYGQLRQFIGTPEPTSQGGASTASSSAAPSASPGPGSGAAGTNAAGTRSAGSAAAPAVGGAPRSTPGSTAPFSPGPAARPPATPSGTAPPSAAGAASPGGATGTSQPSGASPSGSAAPSTTLQATVSAASVTVTAVATDRSWVRAVADGVTVFEGFLSAGDQQVWQAKRQLTLRVGNASALSLTVNGRSVGRLGNPGDVVDETYTALTP
ncbi:MAG TPA: RodZ domain-containing protein [bacterium]|nr:RodZ domain-containing protein [bacterium]